MLSNVYAGRSVEEQIATGGGCEGGCAVGNQRARAKRTTKEGEGGKGAEGADRRMAFSPWLTRECSLLIVILWMFLEGSPS